MWAYPVRHRVSRLKAFLSLRSLCHLQSRICLTGEGLACGDKAEPRKMVAVFLIKKFQCCVHNTPCSNFTLDSSVEECSLSRRARLISYPGLLFSSCPAARFKAERSPV